MRIVGRGCSRSCSSSCSWRPSWARSRRRPARLVAQVRRRPRARSTSPGSHAPVDGDPRRRPGSPRSVRRHPRRPLLRPGLRPRLRAHVADGGLAPHRRRPPQRAVRGVAARHGPLHPDARLASGGRARPGGAIPRTCRRRCSATRPASTPGSRARGPASASPSSSPACQAGKGGGSAATTPSPGRPSTPSRFGQAPGVVARRQLRHRALPAPGRHPARRPRPHRPPRPALPAGRPDDHADGTSSASPGARRTRRPPRLATSRAARPRRAGAAPGRRGRPRHRPSPASAAAIVAGRRPGDSAAGRGRAASRHRLEQLGGRRPVERDRPRAAGERSAPRRSRCRASGIMNGLHCRGRRRRLPVRRGRGLLPGRAGASILGHNARIAWGATNVGPGRPGPLRRDARSGRPGALPLQGRVAPVRRPATRRSRSPAAIPSRSPSARPSTGRCSTTSYAELPTRERSYALALDRPRRAGRAVRRRSSRLTRSRDFAASSAPRFAGYGAPSQNFVYADVDGNIGYQIPGRVPIRPAARRRATAPSTASSGDRRLDRLHPVRRPPALYNPPGGLIVTANNTAVDGAYPYHLGRRLGSRLAGDADPPDCSTTAAPGGGVTQADLPGSRSTRRCSAPTDLIPTLSPATPATADGRCGPTGSATLGPGRAASTAHGCAAYEVTEWRLLRGRLRAVARDAGSRCTSAPTRAHGRSASRWTTWPARSGTTRRPPAVETTRDAGSRRPSTRPGAELRAALGDPARWAWGRVHTDDVQGADPGLERHRAARGGTSTPALRRSPGTTTRSTTTTTSRGAPGIRIPTTRRPCRPASLDAFTLRTSRRTGSRSTCPTLDAARIVITTGQSGNPFDRHYGDLIDDWSTGGRWRSPSPGMPSRRARPRR